MFKSYEERGKTKRPFVGAETPKEFSETAFYFLETAFRKSTVYSLEIMSAFPAFPYLKTNQHETI